MTARLTELTLDGAKQIATEALDQSAVTDLMKKKVIGKYFDLKCVPMGTNYLVVEVI
jgi:ssDNA-binding replication factor A large subunit